MKKGNKIGDDGTQMIGRALKINSTLNMLYLSGYEEYNKESEKRKIQKKWINEQLMILEQKELE